MADLNAIRPAGSTGRVIALRPRPQGAAGFSIPNDFAASPARASEAPSTVSLSALLSLQSEAEPVQDRAARQHGRALLDELYTLHQALLGNFRNFKGLSALRELAATPTSAAEDPRLRDAVAEITLRARIELARYGADQ